MDIMCMWTLSPALPVSDDVQVCTYPHLQQSFFMGACIAVQEG